MSVKKKSFLILFIVVLLLTTVFVTPVSAVGEWYDGVVDFQDFEDRAYNKLGNKNYLKKGVYDATKWRYVGVAALFDNNTEMFKSDWLMNQTGGKMQDYIKDISSAVLVIGRMFCLLYFLLSLMESATRDSFTIEIFIKSFAKFALIFVIFSPSTIATITEFMAAIEDNMLGLINGGATSSYEELGKYVEIIATNNMIENIGLLLGNLIIGIGCQAAILVIYFVIFGRTLELAIYTSLLPVGMASIYNGGLNSPGFRYVKKCFALYIQGAIIFIITILSSALTNRTGSTGNAIINCFYTILLMFTTAALIARSKSIANDVMGV